jgi:hypothetical protein
VEQSRSPHEHAVPHMVDEAQYRAFLDSDMAAFDALPASVRAAIQKSLVPPPSQLVAQWVRLVGARKSIEMLEQCWRHSHNEAVKLGEVCPVRPGDSLSL